MVTPAGAVPAGGTPAGANARARSLVWQGSLHVPTPMQRNADADKWPVGRCILAGWLAHAEQCPATGQEPRLCARTRVLHKGSPPSKRSHTFTYTLCRPSVCWEVRGQALHEAVLSGHVKQYRQWPPLHKHHVRGHVRCRLCVFISVGAEELLEGVEH